MEGDSILVVDGDAASRTLLCEGLDRAGLSAVGAADAEEALDRLGRGGIAVAIVDLGQPPTSGHELLDELRRARIDVPVIVTTALGTFEDAVRALRNGALDFLEKPFDTDFLVETVRGALKVRARIDAGAERLVGHTPARSATPVPPPPPASERTQSWVSRQVESSLLGHVRDRLKGGALNLPVAHPVLRDVSRLMGNPRRRGIRFVQGIVERDHQLALRVLHRAAVERAAGTSPPRNLRAAVDVLGRSAVVDVAVASVTERMEAGRVDRRRGRLSHELWRRSVGVATAARVLAEGTQGDPDES